VDDQRRGVAVPTKTLTMIMCLLNKRMRGGIEHDTVRNTYRTSQMTQTGQLSMPVEVSGWWVELWWWENSGVRHLAWRLLALLSPSKTEESMSMDGKTRRRELTVSQPTSWAVVAMSRGGRQHDKRQNMKREEGTSTSMSES
jgi:hypothetical protein